MSEKKTIIKESSIGFPGQEKTAVSFLNRHVLFGMLAFIILAALSASLVYQQYRIIRQEQKKEGYVVAEYAKEKIQGALTNSLSATRILSFFIDQHGVVKNFDSVAAQILSTNKGIDALELVPGGVIQHVYPLQGNEKVLGYNILKDSTRSQEAFRAIGKNELFFSGPFDLKQGGFGIVGRLPVFREGRFWGFSAVVIKMATLIKAADIDPTGKNGYYYQLSKINPGTRQNEFFIPHAMKPLKDYEISLELPVGDWKLSVEPVEKNKGITTILIFALIGLLFAVFGGIFVTAIFRRPEKLEQLVIERTRELKKSEKKYRSVVERVSDAFIALDVNWVYTYVNEKAGELLLRKPETLVGENIWTEFPKAVHQPSYHAYHKAMQLQEYQYLEEYFPPVNKWFESHIYPSKDGLTVFFKDVTEIKQITLALKNNEEKYRSLIEQASDGIVITDLEGIIIEVNNSIKNMIGYGEEEMIGSHLARYLFQTDSDVTPLRIHELMKGKVLLYERKLLKKDGTVIDVEINAKMASSHTLIGFIRDITEREKAAEILQQSEKKYKLLFYNNPLPMLMATIPGRDIIDVNEAAIKQYGYTREEFLQMNSRNLRIGDDGENSMEEAETMQPVITDIRAWHHKKKNGAIIQVETYSHHIMYEGKMVWLGLLKDVTEKYAAKALQQKSYEDIRQLASNLQTIREDERTAIAREIHDELGQQLTGLKLDLHWLMRKINSTDDGINSKMKESIELINATIGSVRKISADLRPSILDDLGLLPALEWHGEEFEKRSGTKVMFVNEVGDFVVSSQVATGIFRIYQELLTNIARHANASMVKTSLSKDADRLYFKIEDNGVGVDTETIKNKRTLGLLGIKERSLIFGGTYDFISKPGDGSVTTITIPLQLTKINM